MVTVRAGGSVFEALESVRPHFYPGLYILIDAGGEVVSPFEACNAGRYVARRVPTGGNSLRQFIAEVHAKYKDAPGFAGVAKDGDGLVVKFVRELQPVEPFLRTRTGTVPVRAEFARCRCGHVGGHKPHP